MEFSRFLLRGALAILVLAACGPAPSGHAPAQSVTVGVEPRSTDVQVGGTARFAATVTGTADTGVAWTVVEPSGGSVDPTGLYRAPAATGTFHVRATSNALSDVYAESTITVVAQPVVGIAISPRTPSVVAGGTIAFGATVTNTTNTAVTWSVAPAGCGAITAAGVYTAPSSAGTCTVVGTSQADPTKLDTATVTVTAPPVVAVSPKTPSVVAGATISFSATVSNTTNTAVTWSVAPAGCGTITAAGVYTAPSAAGTCTVAATSQADPTRSDTATVTVTAPPAVAVAISPKTPSVVAGGTIAFTATVTNTANTAVTWSVATAGCGTITAAGVYTAPSAAGTCTVVGRSQADPTKSDTATVTVTAPVTVAVTPSPAAADACKTVTFTATVTGATDRSVTWSVQEGTAGGSITTAGVYTAPTAAGTYHVVATSKADPAKSAVVAVTVSERVLSVTVSPPQIQVVAGGTAQLTATVTTTCGTTTATQTISSTGQIVAQ